MSCHWSAARIESLPELP